MAFIFTRDWTCQTITDALEQGIFIGLFTDPTEVNVIDVLDDYTEADFAGYAPVEYIATLSCEFGDAAISFATYTDITFACEDDLSEDVTVLGYYLYDPGRAILVGSQLFDEAKIIRDNGDTITFSLNFRAGNTDDFCV